MNLTKQLEELQWKQLRHDELYHKEIWLLSVQNRIKHMTLHLAKYGAQLSIQVYENDREGIEKSILDTFIITTSSLNMFNHRASDFLIGTSSDDTLSIDELGSKLVGELAIQELDFDYVTRELLKHAGIMCKAVESLDHLEPYDFRGTLLVQLESVFKLTLAALNKLTDKPIFQLVEERLLPVEKKNMFFERYGNYATGY